MQLTTVQIDFLEHVIDGNLTPEYVNQISDPELYSLYLGLMTTGFVDAKPKAAFYLALAEMTDGQSGVDVAVTLWLRGAAEVNSGIGSQSDFIRARVSRSPGVEFIGKNSTQRISSNENFPLFP